MFRFQTLNFADFVFAKGLWCHRHKPSNRLGLERDDFPIFWSMETFKPNRNLLFFFYRPFLILFEMASRISFVSWIFHCPKLPKSRWELLVELLHQYFEIILSAPFILMNLSVFSVLGTSISNLPVKYFEVKVSAFFNAQGNLQQNQFTA